MIWLTILNAAEFIVILVFWYCLHKLRERVKQQERVIAEKEIHFSKVLFDKEYAAYDNLWTEFTNYIGSTEAFLTLEYDKIEYEQALGTVIRMQNSFKEKVFKEPFICRKVSEKSKNYLKRLHDLMRERVNLINSDKKEDLGRLKFNDEETTKLRNELIEAIRERIYREK